MTMHPAPTMPDSLTRDPEDLEHALRPVRTFELRAVNVRIDGIDAIVKEQGKTQDQILHVVNQYALEHVALKTTIRNASAAMIVLIPLFASFGAWLVLKQFEPEKHATTAAVELPEIRQSVASTAQPRTAK